MVALLLLFFDNVKIEIDTECKAYQIKVSFPENRIFNRIISDSSVAPRETTPTISGSQFEFESESDFPFYNGNNRHKSILNTYLQGP